MELLPNKDLGRVQIVVKIICLSSCVYTWNGHNDRIDANRVVLLIWAQVGAYDSSGGHIFVIHLAGHSVGQQVFAAAIGYYSARQDRGDTCRRF